MTAAPYPDNAAYLGAELDKLDALLRLRLAAFRRAAEGRLRLLEQGLVISEEKVDELLAQTPEADEEADLRQRVVALEKEIQRRREASLEAGVFLGLPRLCGLFALSELEAQVVLVCLAPELRRKYDTLYAYLQDDVTRKRPSVDLALELLLPREADRWSARALLAETAPLLRHGLLQPVEDAGSPSGSSGLACFLRLDPRILQFLLGHPAVDARLVDLARMEDPSAEDEDDADASLVGSLVERVGSYFSGEQPRRLVIHLHGPHGVGKRRLARALSAGLGCPLLTLDAGRLPARAGEAETLARLALRESFLSEAPLYLDGIDALTSDDALLRGIGRALDDAGWLLFLAGEKPWTRPAALGDAAFLSLRLAVPPVPVRERVWRRTLAERPDAGEAAATLARRFRLTPGQIREAVMIADWRCGAAPPDAAALAAACRERSALKLGELALKVEPRYGWADLVLPEEKKEQLAELADQVRHGHKVWDEWGFGGKLAHGRGVSVLFSGPPGTGKTMAAQVLARDLDLDLYKIDLSQVVSKYIGETEKNLSRIFAEAEQGNAILFFDEADALFGKRTEISDAHDRYANVETSYLLQRMEEHDGVVILASNLRTNMDDAFLRRLRHVVEFPFPDAAHRLEIWRAHLPAAAPVAPEVDCRMLAERLQVAGGHIRNIVVSAAFFAAADGGVIGMAHVLRGARREFEKIGKLWDEKSFAGGR